METIKKIGLTELLGHGSFSISCNLVIQFVTTFILFFYTDVFGIAPAAAGAILAVGMAYDGITDPVVAGIIDNRRFKNGERTRPLIKYICVPLSVALIVMFTPITIHGAAAVFYCLLIYLVYDTLTTLLRLPGFALPTLATSNQQDRLNINTFISGGATVGAVMASVLCWPLVLAFSGLDDAGGLINPQRGFPLAAAVIGLIIIAGGLFCYHTTRERVFPKDKNEQKLSLWKAFKTTMSNYNCRWNTAFSTLYFVSNSLLSTTLVYYCAVVHRNPALVTPIMAVFAIGSLIALPFVRKIDNKIGRRKAMMLGAGLILISKIPFLFFPLNIYAMYVNALIMGLSVALNIVTFSTTRSEVSDHIEFVNNRRLDSMVINCMGLVNKYGTALTVLAIGLVLQFTGYDANLDYQPQAVTTGLIAIMGWVAVGVAALMLFCASKITIEKVMIEMKEAETERA